MTGMRRTEICDLTWEMVDYRHRCFRLPESKTGQKVVPVSSRVLDLVRECRSKWKACSFDPKPRFVVFSQNGQRLEPSSLSRTWCTGVRDRIPGLEGVRLHDLRHSMASDAIMSGVPLAVVGKILGHRKPETTARYAHIADTVLNDAVELVAETIHRGTKTGKRRKK
jgi:integrase